jgi:hypothetical protein
MPLDTTNPIAVAAANLRNLASCVERWDPANHDYSGPIAEARAAAAALDGLPSPAGLVQVMREVRDASSFDLNPHDRACPVTACGCQRGRRIVAAWRAFHDALAAAGVPPLVAVEQAARDTSAASR